MPGSKWTQPEIDFLEWEWTSHDVAELARQLGRTPAAVREKARSLGLGSVKRGTFSLLEVANMTGYDRGRIITAAKRAGINLPRAPRTRNSPKGRKRRHYAIPLETVERLTAYLATIPDGSRLWRTHGHEWGGRFRNGDPKPEKCTGCGRDDRRHYSRGLCRPCHDARTRRLRRS